jgi:hypothetical protein
LEENRVHRFKYRTNSNFRLNHKSSQYSLWGCQFSATLTTQIWDSHQLRLVLAPFGKKSPKAFAPGLHGSAVPTKGLENPETSRFLIMASYQICQ